MHQYFYSHGKALPYDFCLLLLRNFIFQNIGIKQLQMLEKERLINLIYHQIQEQDIQITINQQMTYLLLLLVNNLKKRTTIPQQREKLLINTNQTIGMLKIILDHNWIFYKFNQQLFDSMEILDHLTPLKTILLCFILFIFYISYKFILVPYLKFIRLRKEIKGKYQAYQYPFTPYGFSFILRLIKDFKQYGDSLHHRKHILPKKDIAISTMRDQLTINLIDNKLIHEFLQKQKEGYYAKVKNGLNMSSFFQILGTGLLLSEGEEWRYKRKIMSTLFNFQFIKRKTQTIIDISKSACQDIAKEKKENGELQIKVVRLFQRIFGTVVIKCFFGDIQLQPINGKNIFDFLSELLQKVANRNFMISSFILSPLIKKFGIRKIDRQINLEVSMFRAYVKQVIDCIIKSINQGTIPKDSQGLIAKLLRNKQFVQESSQQYKIQNNLYTYEDLINQMCTFFSAGTDTTSSVIGSLMHMLARRKDVQQKLRDQIKGVIDDDIANLNLENIKKMPYLKWVQYEILRVATSTPNLLAREALKDHKIGDITISKGTIINIEILSNHYKEEFFQNPFQFIPERWEKLQNQANIGQMYFPFSFGLRSCIGQQLALIEGRIAVVIFMLYFKNGRELQPQRNKLGITYGPYQSKMLFQTI